MRCVVLSHVALDRVRNGLRAIAWGTGREKVGVRTQDSQSGVKMIWDYITQAVDLKDDTADRFFGYGCVIYARLAFQQDR